jgi:hypothetical protein
MRRSAGFAQAFLSILKAEPSGLPPVLLPVVLQHMLYFAFNASVPPEFARVARPAGAPVAPADVPERCRVHALNILKLLFHDSSLVRGLEAYVAPALHASVLGFQSGSWAVRNSSMMVFSEVVTR